MSKKEIKIKRKTIKFKGEELFLDVAQYTDNNRLAILCTTKNELYCDLTINLSDGFFLMDMNEAFISDMAKSCGLEKKLLDAGVIKEVICVQPYNYGRYDLVSFDMKKLREFDPIGLDKYYKSFDYELHYSPKI